MAEPTRPLTLDSIELEQVKAWHRFYCHGILDTAPMDPVTYEALTRMANDILSRLIARDTPGYFETPETQDYPRGTTRSVVVS